MHVYDENVCIDVKYTCRRIVRYFKKKNLNLSIRQKKSVICKDVNVTNGYQKVCLLIHMRDLLFIHDKQIEISIAKCAKQ